MKKELQTAFNPRQYMLSKDFELYYYNDKNLSRVAPHSHNYYEFYFFLEGDVDLIIDGISHQIKSGDFFLIPPHVKHHLTLRDPKVPYRRFILWISTEYCGALTQTSTDYIYLMQLVITTKQHVFHCDTLDFNAIQSMIFQLLEEMNTQRFGRDATLPLQINTLLLYMNRLVHEQVNSTSIKGGTSLYVNVMNYISENLETDLTLEDLAKVFYVSKYHIAHTFKENIGISVHQFITKKRLQACRNAILDNTSITKVFEQYGFHDYSNFYRAFKKEYGLSPKEYKETHQLPL